MASLLVADDDHDMGELLALALESHGHTVRLAHNGQEALALLTAPLPDLVLLDVEMPLLSGPDMAYLMLLRNCGKEKIPVVFHSGVVGLAGIAASVGTPYFISKPCPIEDLQALIDRALVERISPDPGGAP